MDWAFNIENNLEHWKKSIEKQMECCNKNFSKIQENPFEELCISESEYPYTSMDISLLQCNTCEKLWIYEFKRWIKFETHGGWESHTIGDTYQRELRLLPIKRSELNQIIPILNKTKEEYQLQSYNEFKLSIRPIYLGGLLYNNRQGESEINKIYLNINFDIMEEYIDTCRDYHLDIDSFESTQFIFPECDTPYSFINSKTKGHTYWELHSSIKNLMNLNYRFHLI